MDGNVKLEGGVFDGNYLPVEETSEEVQIPVRKCGDLLLFDVKADPIVYRETGRKTADGMRIFTLAGGGSWTRIVGS